MEKNTLLRDQLSLLALQLNEISLICSHFNVNNLYDMQILNQLKDRHLKLTIEVQKLLIEYSQGDVLLEALVDLRLFEYDLNQTLGRSRISTYL